MSNSDLLLDGLGDSLAEQYRVVAFDRRGHGYTADSPEPFHYEDMATETIGVLETSRPSGRLERRRNHRPPRRDAPRGAG